MITTQAGVAVQAPRRRVPPSVRITAALVAAVALVACGGNDDASTDTDTATPTGTATGTGTVASVAAPAGTASELIVATGELPLAFGTDGGAANNTKSIEFSLNTQAGLIRNKYAEVDGHFEQDQTEFEGVLAESYDVSDDGLVYTFHLKQGVLSVAGNELTADDVVWSWERKFADPTSGLASIMNPVITDPASQVKKVDDYTVTFTIERPGYGLTLLTLLSKLGPIYDTTVLKANATDDDPYAIQWSYDNFMYGFGAYYRTSYTDGQQLVLEANPNYVFGEPAIKKITYQVVANAGTRANSLRSGDVDYAQNLTPADQAALDADDAAYVPTVAKPNNFLIVSFNTSVEELADPAVRQAFAHAIPYDRINESVYSGRAVPTTGFLANTPPPADLAEYDYNPELAKQLLAEAGYPDGIDLTVAVNSATPDIVQAVVQIRDAAAEAGFDITIDEQPPAQFGETTFTKQYEVFAFNNFAIVVTPQYELNLFLGADSFLNYSGWQNEDFTAAFSEGLTFQDQFGPEANAAFGEAERIALDEVPMIWVSRIQPTIALSHEFTGWADRSDTMTDFALMRPAG